MIKKTLNYKSMLLIPCYIILFEVLGSLSGYYSQPGEWYVDIIKSPYNPPGYIFPIAWTLLYALLAVYAWSLWHLYSEKKDLIQYLKIGFLIQMAINFLWSFVFFKMMWTGLACFMIMVMIVITCSLCITSIYHGMKTGFLLCPYILWLIFAQYLALFIYLHN